MTAATTARILLGLAAVAAAAASAACIANSQTQFERGEAAYGEFCFACHEEQGGIGTRLTRDVLAVYGTAELLYRYNRDNMPYEEEASLTAQQYRDITGYLLVLHELAPPSFELTADNGSLVLEAGSE